jgi:hypothetical protein
MPHGSDGGDWGREKRHKDREHQWHSERSGPGGLECGTRLGSS